MFPTLKITTDSDNVSITDVFNILIKNAVERPSGDNIYEFDYEDMRFKVESSVDLSGINYKVTEI